MKEKGQGSLEVATHTSTVELIDDFEPLTDDLEPDTLSRNNSAVHIRVYKTESLGSGEVVSESVKSWQWGLTWQFEANVSSWKGIKGVIKKHYSVMTFINWLKYVWSFRRCFTSFCQWKTYFFLREY